MALAYGKFANAFSTLSMFSLVKVMIDWNLKVLSEVGKTTAESGDEWIQRHQSQFPKSALRSKEVFSGKGTFDTRPASVVQGMPDRGLVQRG